MPGKKQQEDKKLPNGIDKDIIKNLDKAEPLPDERDRMLNVFLKCHNGKKDLDNDESDIDCGGKCEPCDPEKKCKDNTDCKSQQCQDLIAGEYGTCAKPVCADTPTGVEVENFGPFNNKCEGNTVTRYKCTSYENIKRTGRFYENITRECPTGTYCNEGSCITDERSCKENDIQNNIHLLGIAREPATGIEKGRDRCTGYNKLQQVKCKVENVEYTPEQTCPENEICANGVCITQEYCTEPNPEERFPNATIIETESETETRRHIDECATEKRIRHIICDGRQPQVSETECEENEICNKGICGQQELHCTEYEWGAIDKNGERYGNYCGNSPTIKYTANCYPEGYVEFEPGYCDQGVCHWGKCMTGTCSDSDGNNRTNAGNVHGDTEELEGGYTSEYRNYDFCESDLHSSEDIPENDRVWEAVCSEDVMDRNGNPNSFSNNILADCNENQHCATRYDLTGERPEQVSYCAEGSRNYRCVETDNGRDINKSGKLVTSREELNQYYHEDYCQNSRTVIEYYCRDRGYYSTENIRCPDDTPYCDEGACVKCTDTDPANNAYERGKVKDINGLSHTDFCRGDKLVELSCGTNSETVETERECPEGSVCTRDYPGRCEPTGTCCNDRHKVWANSKEECYNFARQWGVELRYVQDLSENACQNI